jgi:hypothetical protein
MVKTAFFEHDLEGTTDRPGGTDKFTKRAPAAISRRFNFNGTLGHYQGAAGANINTQSAPLAFGLVDHRHFFHINSPNL